jgi:hypothetical protein
MIFAVEKGLRQDTASDQRKQENEARIRPKAGNFQFTACYLLLKLNGYY